VVEVGVRGGKELGFEDRDTGEEILNLGKRFPADKDFEFGEGDGYLRFVVCVAEFLWVFLVKFGGEFLIRVDLEGECFGNGQNLNSNQILSFTSRARVGWKRSL